jgi:hypothetical protein
MKNIFLLVTLLFSGLNIGFSQSEKNDIKLTVSALPLFNFDNGFNGMVIKPAIGYFFSDRSSIEINFSYATANNLYVGGVPSYYNSYAITPTLRNNFVNKETVRVFAEIGFGLGTIKYDANNADLHSYHHDNISGGISVFDIGFGANYYFNDKFGLEVIIPYIQSKIITSSNHYLVYSGFGPTVGLTYKLN